MPSNSKEIFEALPDGTMNLIPLLTTANQKIKEKNHSRITVAFPIYLIKEVPKLGTLP